MGVGPRARKTRGDRLGDIGVEVRERLVKAFRVADGDAARPLRGRLEPRPPAAQLPARLPEPQVGEPGGLFLAPLEAALGAMDPELEAVLGPGRGLGDPQHPPGAVRVAEKHAGGIVELASRHHRPDVGADLARLRAGDRMQQVPGVGADIRQNRRRTGPGGIETPVVGILQIGAHGKLRLDVLDLGEPQLPEVTVRDHRPRLPHHGIGGVVVGGAEDETARPHPGDEIAGIFEAGRERLVADDVPPGIEPAAGERIVALVGGHDRDDVHPVRARGLGREHRADVAVSALRRPAEGPPRGAGTLGVRRQHPRRPPRSGRRGAPRCGGPRR